MVALLKMRFACPRMLTLPPNASVRAELPGGGVCWTIEMLIEDMENSCESQPLRGQRREVRGDRVIGGIEREVEPRQVLGRGAQRPGIDGAQLREVQRFHQQLAQGFRSP